MAKAGKQQKENDVLHYLRIAIAILLVALVLLLLFFAFRLGRAVFSTQGMTQKKGEHRTYELEIKEGESVYAVGRELEKNGIIESSAAFYLQSRIFQAKIPVGTYTVSSADSSRTILKNLNQEWLKMKKAEEDNDG